MDKVYWLAITGVLDLRMAVVWAGREHFIFNVPGTCDLTNALHGSSATAADHHGIGFSNGLAYNGRLEIASKAS